MSILKLLIGGAGATAPPVTPPTLNTLRQVTDFTFHNRTTTTISATTTYRTTHTVKAASTDPRIVFPENPTTDPYTVAAASIEYPAGTFTPVRFGGAAGITVADQAGPIVSDTVTGLALAAGATVYVRVAYAAGVIPTAMGALTAKDWALGDLTASGAMTANAGIVNNQPALVGFHALAASSTVTVAGIGDSIMERGNDDSSPGSGGFFRRAAVESGFPWTNYAVWANSHYSSYSERNIRYGTSLGAHTHALVEYGINDLNNATTAAQVQGYAIQHWTWLKTQGPKLWQTTTTPNSSTTDSFATLAGQTATASAARRVIWNDWLRDGAPIIAGAAGATGTTDPSAVRAGQAGHPLSGILEVADTVESSRNSGLWAVNGTANYLTSDGIHPSTAAHLLIKPVIQTWMAGLAA